MPVLDQIEKINGDTTLIDIGMFGVSKIAGVYLLQGEKKCLIDSGSQKEAKRLIKALTSLDAFPPDIIILTHAHYDHAQGVPSLLREAEKQGKKIEVMASSLAIPLLADASYNEPFNKGPYESIENVTPIEEGDLVDLGGQGLEIYSTPGHCSEHIALLDRQNGHLFAGDAPGYYWNSTRSYVPHFMPPSWNPELFSSSLDKLKNLQYEKLCLAHYGVLNRQEALDFLGRAEEYCTAWWELFEKNEDKLDQPAELLAEIMNTIKPVGPEQKILSPKLKMMFAVLVAGKKLTGKKPPDLTELLLLGILGDLVSGYRTYKQP